MRAPLAALLTVLLTALLSCDGESTGSVPDGGSTPELVCDPGQTRSCYEGPEITQNVGNCGGGVQSCLLHGRGWGPCVGQVLPEQEDCDISGDENCDGLSSCGQTIWANRSGGDRDEVVFRMNADAAGNLYIGGFYRTPIDLGGGELPSNNASIDLLIAKYDADGEHVWSRGIYGSSSLQPRDVAVSQSGDAVVFIANVIGEVFVGDVAIPPNGDDDILIVKLDGEGDVTWWKRLGDSQEQFPMGVALDDAGNVILTGYFRGVIDFGGGEPVTSSGFGLDAFVAKFDSDGEELWSRGYNGPLDQVPRDVAVAADGRVLVTGRISGRVDLGGGELTAVGQSRDIFLLALDAEGEHLFSRVWGGDGDDEAWAVATDSAGQVIFTGRFEQSVRFGAAGFDAVGAGAIFVAKVDEAGTDVWATRIGGASEQSATDLTIDSRDRIVITGYYEGDVDFGATKLPPGGIREPNILVAKLEPSGAPIWARGIVVEGNQDTGGVFRGWRSVAALPGDFIALAGFAQRSIDFGDGPLEDFGGADLLISTLAP